MARIMDALEKAIVKQRRKRISRQMFETMEACVRYGPFTGLKLGGDANTSAGNLGAKVCGLYEQGLLRWIAAHGPYRDVINFGAADGYFSIGLLVAGQAERSICFEMTQTGRDAVARNARVNGVSDNVIVHGIADDTAGALLQQDGVDPSGALVLCDIEGAEFSVLTEKVLSDLAGATLIVELHDRLMAQGTTLRDQLIARLPKGAQHEILTSAPPDWSGIPEVEAMTDYDRALVAIDGRKVLGEWLIVTYPVS